MESNNRTINFLKEWGRLSRAVEGVLIDNVAATAPWLAPIIPAYMAWQAMVQSLLFPPLIAAAGALVVEFLGLSAVSTTFSFWDYNDARRKTDQRAPVAVALVTSLFYLTVILTVNVVLDTAPLVHRIAKGLLSSLSVVAAVVLALRAQHTRRLTSIEYEKQERRELRNDRKQAGNLPESSGKMPRGNDWRNLPSEERATIPLLSTGQIASRYKVSERTARNWRARAGY